MRQAQERADRRTRIIVISAVAVIVLAVVAAVGGVIWQQQAQVNAARNVDASDVLGIYADGRPVIVNGNGVVTEADPNLPTLTEYFDYTCHACADLDAAAGEGPHHLGSPRGTTTSSFSRSSPSNMEYLKPATSASLIVAQKAPDKWVDFHHALLAYFRHPVPGLQRHRRPEPRGLLEAGQDDRRRGGRPLRRRRHLPAQRRRGLPRRPPPPPGRTLTTAAVTTGSAPPSSIKDHSTVIALHTRRLTSAKQTIARGTSASPIPRARRATDNPGTRGHRALPERRRRKHRAPRRPTAPTELSISEGWDRTAGPTPHFVLA